MKLMDAANRFLAHRATMGIYSQRYMVELHRIFTMLSVYFPELGRISAKSWEKYMEREHTNGVKWATLQRRTAAVRLVLREQGIDTRIQAPHGKQIARETEPKRAVSVEEREAFLAALGKHSAEARLWYTVAFFSALRRAEIDSLTLGWVDFNKETIVVPVSAAKSASADPAIDLHPRAAQAIAQMARERGITDTFTPVFGKRDRRRFYLRAVGDAGINTTGITETHFARHHRITGIYKAGGATAAMQQARHKRITTTEKYIHGSLQEARRGNREAD